MRAHAGTCSCVLPEPLNHPHTHTHTHACCWWNFYSTECEVLPRLSPFLPNSTNFSAGLKDIINSAFRRLQLFSHFYSCCSHMIKMLIYIPSLITLHSISKNVDIMTKLETFCATEISLYSVLRDFWSSLYNIDIQLRYSYCFGRSARFLSPSLFLPQLCPQTCTNNPPVTPDPRFCTPLPHCAVPALKAAFHLLSSSLLLFAKQLNNLPVWETYVSNSSENVNARLPVKEDGVWIPMCEKKNPLL